MKNLIGLLIILFSCVTPFEPEIKGYDNLLVVEGLVTNEGGPHFINISKSLSLGNDSINKLPLSGALVSIEDEDGEIEILTEKNPGHYVTRDDFKGIPGIAYKCVIEIGSNVYESNFQELNNPLSIDSIIYELEDIRGTTEQKVNFFVTNNNIQRSSTSYFRWDYKEDWLYTSPFISYFHLDKNTGEFSRLYDQHVCYLDREGSEIQLLNTKINAQKRIVKQPITSISNRTNKLLYQYLLSIKQYAISEETYNFYYSLRQSNQSLGSLFDPQPGTLPTNIKNIIDSNEPIIGLFEVSGVSVKRLFVAPARVKGFVITPPDVNYPCEVEEYYVAEFRTYDQFFNAILNRLSDRVAFYEFIEEEFTGAVIGMRLINPICIDCERFGAGTNEKPDYWPF